MNNFNRRLKMWYRGVQIIYIDSLNQYQFIYDGCPKDYLKGNHGEPLYIKATTSLKDLTKAEGFIDALIQLGEI
jgi:hypothetical protein